MLQKHVEFADDLDATVRRAMPFIPAQVKAFVMVAMFVFEEVIRLLTRPIEMLTRSGFGIRNMSAFAVAQLLSLAVLGWGFLSVSPGLTVLLTTSGVAAVYHRWEAWRASRRTDDWRHTRYGGRPLPLWGWVDQALERRRWNRTRWFTHMAVLRFGEPMLVLVAGLLLRFLDPVLGVTLMVSAVTLAIKGAIIHQRLLDLEFDRRDAQVISAFLSANPVAKPATITPTFVARLVPPARPPEPAVRPEPPAVSPKSSRLAISCPHCRATLKVRSYVHTRPAVCPNCEGEFQLPPRPAGETVPAG